MTKERGFTSHCSQYSCLDAHNPNVITLQANNFTSCIHTYIHTIRAFIHTHTHTHTHIYIYIYIYIYTGLGNETGKFENIKKN
jgi:hypothetical protein